MTDSDDVQKVIDWYAHHGSSLDDLIAGHRDYTAATRRLGSEPVLDTLRHARDAMHRFVTMIERNQSLPRFGVALIDKHYQAALDHYRRAGNELLAVSADDAEDKIAREIRSAAGQLDAGTDELNATTKTINELAGRRSA